MNALQLTTPMPADIANMLRRDPKLPSATSSVTSTNTPVVSPIPPPQTVPSSTFKPASRLAFSSTLIAEIPPFNPAKSKAQLEASASASVPFVPAAQKAAVVVPPPTPVTAGTPLVAAAPTASTSKINPNAPAFVFRPSASAFTPVGPP